ncbi:MAG: ABC transporter permease [Thiobacillus sp.]|nr:ABC transporter permease [Thiobacillus sp.]
MMRALLYKEILALSRDPHALAALFLMPAIFIVVMSLALKNMYTPAIDRLAYGMDVRETTPLTKRLVTRWEQTHGAAVPLRADWPVALQRGQLAYVLVIEPGLSDALAIPLPPPRASVRLMTDPGLAQSVLRTLEAETIGLVSELRATALLDPAEQMSPADFSVASFIVSAAAGTARTLPNAVQQNVPAWLAFGMFFVVTAMSSLFVQEQRDGTLLRLVSMGVSAPRLIGAKALPYLAINGLQAALMLAVGVWLMPLLGGEALSLAGIHWPALLTVLASVSFAAIGFALLVACLVRTHAQANTLGPTLIILMAALGGIMVPTFAMPETMQQIAAWSPLNWGLEGMLSVLVRHGDLNEAAPWALRLTLFGGTTLLLASLLFSRRLRP